MRFSEKLLLSLKALLFRGHTLALYTASLAFNRIFSKNSVYRYARLTTFDVALRQFVTKKKIDVVLLEQWIIQELWSATIFKLKSYDTLNKRLSRFYFKTDYVFYFDIDVNTAAERIGMRNTNLSRFDRMDAKTRLEELRKYNTYLFQLYESSDCRRKHLFSGYNSPEKNAALFALHFDVKFHSN